MNVWGPMIAVLVGLTMMTVSGIFIFMTFRIDRGTKLEAREEAQKTAKKNAKKNREEDREEDREGRKNRS